MKWHTRHTRVSKMFVPPCVAWKCRVLAAIPVEYLITQIYRTVSIPVRAMPTDTTYIHIHHIHMLPLQGNRLRREGSVMLLTKLA